ncbi:MAG: GNAT family N-acetyltransferase [Butyrivibrio sp.]|nr:GNAT family N-acetyltransferase [Butyrivibrio sp.]
MEGIGIEKNLEKGLFYTRRAAGHGDRDAQYNLGCLYEEGTAVEKDFGKAIYWFDEAAKQDHDLAIHKIQELNCEACVVPFTVEYVDKVIEYENQLRIEEPDTYYWEPDEEYRNNLVEFFSDARFINALSFLALENGKVIGRIDATIISSRADADCSTAYLDWISVLKSKRHGKIAQKMLATLQAVLKDKNIHLLIALMAGNDEAQRFYKSVEGASIHDQGIWMDI